MTRAEYEQSVRELAKHAGVLMASGTDAEAVARVLVERRNALKREARQGLAPELLAMIEARNLRRYSDPVGPTADALFVRYGSWDAVIEAAARPADLRKTGL